MSTNEDRNQAAIYSQLYNLERRDREAPEADAGADSRSERPRARASAPAAKPRKNAKGRAPAPAAGADGPARWPAPAPAVCAEKVAAIRDILSLHAKDLVTDVNAIAVIMDIVKE